MLPERYNPSNAINAIRNPRLLIGEINRLGHYLNQSIHQVLPKDGIKVMEEDWDILIILDSCRYDAYEKCNSFNGDLESVQSFGSHSLGFIQANFIGDTFHDTVYVTANPFASKIPSGTFHDIEYLFSNEIGNAPDPISPSTVADAAIEYHDDYPNKRLIIHFMQPHQPFLGDFGQTLPQQQVLGEKSPGEIRDAFTNYRYGITDITLSDIEKAYYENLELVLCVVERLLDDLQGRTVITADHGELLGERLWPIPVRGIEHAESLRHSALTRVPWHVIPATTRPEIIPEPPVEPSPPTTEQVDDQLKALGYQ